MEAQFNFTSIWEASQEAPRGFSSFFGLSKSKADSKKVATPKLIVEKCRGIDLGGVCVKSLLFSTDMALIENNDSDAVLAVYPFSPSIKIMKALIAFSEKPVICGVGGGLTQGKTSLEMAMAAEDLGAVGIIVNQPFPNKHIEAIKRRVSIPLISSVSVKEFSFADRVNAGVDIFHVTGGKNSAEIIKHITYAAPCYPIISTGGKHLEAVEQSIEAGANAIVLTPPSSGELFKKIMIQYRKGFNQLT